MFARDGSEGNQKDGVAKAQYREYLPPYTIFSTLPPENAINMPYFRHQAFGGSRISSLLGKVMSGSISTLIHRCGPEWFGIYFRQRFHEPPPALSDDIRMSAFGREMARALIQSG
ncbi:MAG: hypothetical protein CMK09_04750 [Ponticaulis sp.]|nr:hypothetical protein [Ponticaulis sp.]